MSISGSGIAAMVPPTFQGRESEDCRKKSRDKLHRVSLRYLAFRLSLLNHLNQHIKRFY